jgi:pyruvate formate lyase activating enzyme
MNPIQGIVFNIQHYSIHDGPGIRTTVFLNGCPLRCVWCQNPESQSLKPQIFFLEEKCTLCGECIDTCPQKAITIDSDKLKTDRTLCSGCGICAKTCPNEARTLMGTIMTPEEVFNDVNSDAIFYETSGGGITISGGDPIAQPEFTIAILKLCKDVGMNTAIETSGFIKWEILSKILENVDMVLYDFKHMSNEKHKEYTGVSNLPILENAKRINKEYPSIKLVARLPVIPGYNDSKENIRCTAEFISRELKPGIKVHLLPYHKLGNTKYERMEMKEKILDITPPSQEYMEELLEIVRSFGLDGVIGG